MTSVNVDPGRDLQEPPGISTTQILKKKQNPRNNLKRTSSSKMYESIRECWVMVFITFVSI